MMALRKYRSSHKSAGPIVVIGSLLRSRFTALISCGIFLILIATAVALIYNESQYILSNTKTIAGDNLGATPWHPFPVSGSDASSQAARLARIVKCNYLSCLPQYLMHHGPPVFPSNGSQACPDYFRWIYEDLAPWRESKITIEGLQEAQQHAAFRVVIVGGRLYTELYYACVQSRAIFTLWGILQLLERYPGMVPDVDLMFDCMDRPSVNRYVKRDRPPPPLFRYCSDIHSFDIPFPDWSFWGWPEIDMRPWFEELESIYSASKNIKWENRDPMAFWKGNPNVGAPIRTALLRCNSTKEHNWRTQIFQQDWNVEAVQGYKNSKLADQCRHRYKIYAEGHAWSVSFKFIFACDSPVLVVSPTYYEFFTRGLIPLVHFWPVKRDDLCPSIKFAVDWGNTHLNEAKAMGKAGQDFMYRNVSMDRVYDYMFHLLNEYSKLQNFQPVVPSNAQLLCKKALLCFTDDLRSKDDLLASEAQVSDMPPCSLAPHDPLVSENMYKQIQNNTMRAWNLEENLKGQASR